MKKLNRRNFLKLAGATAAGGAAVYLATPLLSPTPSILHVTFSDRRVLKPGRKALVTMPFPGKFLGAKPMTPDTTIELLAGDRIIPYGENIKAGQNLAVRLVSCPRLTECTVELHFEKI